jgi:hypothetical protein
MNNEAEKVQLGLVPPSSQAEGPLSGRCPMWNDAAEDIAATRNET